MDTHPPTAVLSAAEYVRLDSYAVEIAEDVLGPAKEEGEGSWRVGDSRSLIIHPGALFYDFRSGSGGRGTINLLKHLHGFDTAAAVVFARKRLAEHGGEGRLAASVPGDETAAKSQYDDARTAQVQTLFERRASSRGTPVELYLASRGLQADDSIVGWIEPSWPGAYGEMITAATDAQGDVLAIQLTRLTLDGRKAPLTPVRMTLRGPHDWGERAVLRLNCDDGPIDTLHLVEGFEDGLSLAAAGVRNIWVLWGLGRLGRVELPLGVKTVVLVRDDDRDNPDAELSLWRGVTRLMGFGVDVRVTPRPKMIAPGANGPMKDVNDLHRHNPELVLALLYAPPAGTDDLTEAAREAIIEGASRLSTDHYDRGREGIAALLGRKRVTPLDEERNRLTAKRIEAAQTKDGANVDEAQLLAWEHPVTGLGEVLDDFVGVSKKVIAAPDTHHDAVALWAVQTHLLQRRELGIRHASRLAFQSQFEDSGKTTAMSLLLYTSARAMATSSLTGASLFRETDAHHWSIMWDEADNAFHKNTTPELVGIFNAGWSRKFSLVHRQVPAADGGYETQTFDTFTAIALTAIHEFPSRAMQSRCIVLVMKRTTPAEAARLEEFGEEHEAALTVCGRKLTRWAADLDALPEVAKAGTGLINRIWLNWRPLLQIAKLAGGTWPARALAAAKADMARVTGEKDDSVDYALLAAIWRVLAADKSNPRRMLTQDLIPKLHNEDEGRWLVANRGQAINDYYLRDKLKKLLPTEGEYATNKSRRWRPDKGTKSNPLFGYHELHFADPFERYLGQGLPSAEPRPPELAAYDSDLEKVIPKMDVVPPLEGVSFALLSDTTDTSPKNDSISSTYYVSDIPKASDTVSDALGGHPTQDTSVSDEGGKTSDTVSDEEGPSDPRKLEQYQGDTVNVLDVSDKSANETPYRGAIPGVAREIVQFPQGAVGRKLRKEL